MSVIGSNIIAGASGTVETGYQIARSLRFNSADTTRLTRTPASAGNRQKWTYSFWIKRSAISNTTARTVLSADNGVGTSNYSDFYFNDFGGSVFVCDFGPDATRATGNTTAVFRDPGAWIHGVIAVDTTQATAANRVKLYFNNVLYSLSTYPSQNYNTDVNNTIAHSIGSRGVTGADQYLDGYMADIRLIDGQQLDPTSFGEIDANTGVWVPKAYTGTYGTNGFWLKFDDNSGTTSTTLGKDSSGNSNNWTPNNFSVTAGAGNDSLVDSPTNYGTDTGAGGEVRGNYATWNPLAKDDGTTLTNGNLDLSSTNYGNNTATFFLTSGKWYWEGQGTGYVGAICGNSGINWSTSISNTGSNSIGWWEGGPVYWDGGNNGGSTTFTSTDVVGVALDMDAGVVYFYKNGTLTYTITFGSGTVPNLSAGVFPCFNNGISSGTTKSVSTNFGQRPFAYTAPSGFKALCTQNLPTPAIGASASTLASKNFNTLLWTGDGSSSNRSFTGVGFAPDLVWVKNRGVGEWHVLSDIVRGGAGNKSLSSNSTNAEGQFGSGNLQSFDADGFTFTAGSGSFPSSIANYNSNSTAYVGWSWKANGAGSSNTAGSITSTVSANTTAGISVVTYTGTGANATVGHGLSVAPRMMIFKNRSSAIEWQVYHASIGNGQYGVLNSTAAFAASGIWQNTTPTSTVFSIGNFSGVNANGNNYVAYCFAEVAGFSKFGSYTGNGSADGPFVYCGFRPRWILLKRSSTAGDWHIYDSVRGTYNLVSMYLAPNQSNAEYSGDNQIDILSNGFKLRSTNTGSNENGTTIIFAAFAEAPFNYARAR